MNQIMGYKLDGEVQRHVHLHLYDASRNHDKVYHLVVTENESGQQQVFGMYGRRGSSLRLIEKTKGWTSRWSAEAIFQKALNKEISGGYRVQEDETFRPGPPDVEMLLPDVDDSMELLLPEVWTPLQYAENPVRATAVNPDYDLKGYGVVLLPAGKRILTLVRGTTKSFFDQHGGEITVDQSLFDSLYDLEGQFILDGQWDGDRYLVYDAPSEDDYATRVTTLSELIDGTVGEGVDLADIYLTTAEAAEAVRDSREHGAQMIIGIKLDTPERPGQSDRNRISMTLEPRAVLCVMSAGPDGLYSLGVDDGLGMIEVCKLSMPEKHEPGEQVVVEYQTWAGHGHPLKSPKYIKRLSEPADCTIEQLLAV